jgi:hypothetical protein
MAVTHTLGGEDGKAPGLGTHAARGRPKGS